MKPKHLLFFGAAAICAPHLSACSSKFDACAERRTCAPRNGSGAAGAAGDETGAAGMPESSSGDGGAAAAGTESDQPTLGQPCNQNAALACNGSAQKLRLLCDSGAWRANGTCTAEENCDQSSGLCATVLAECKDKAGGSVVCAAGEIIERCGADLVTDDEVETCAGKCVPLAASAKCAPSTCGDGKIEAPEECDDGNTVNDDTCTNACTNAVCGDGITWANHEECDDGNIVNTDGCLAECKIATCGDMYVQAGKEQCDYNDSTTADLCARNCNLSSWALWPMPNPATAPGLPHQAAYDTTKAGVVTDKVTGLMWQRAVDPGSYSLTGAKAYCAALVLAGYSDWRLPTRIELVSIVDYTIAQPGPTIDSVAFPGTPGTIFFTSSIIPGSTAWTVEFDRGDTTNYGYTTASVRCVR